MKKLRKLFKEYEKISQKPFGSFSWAYSKPRETIIEMRGGFATYRSIFSKVLLIINEAHNQDQARALEELKEQARKASEERKEMLNKLKAMEKKADERRKKSDELLMKKIEELGPQQQATPEKRSKVLEGWLVEEKGVGKEEAKNYASKALKDGKVPNITAEIKLEVKKTDKKNKTPKRIGQTETKSSGEVAKKVGNSSVSTTSPTKKAEKVNENGKVKLEVRKSNRETGDSGNNLPTTKAKANQCATKPKTSNDTDDKISTNDKVHPNSLGKAEKSIIKPSELSAKKAPPPKAENKDKIPPADTRPLTQVRKPKPPVILVQEPHEMGESTKRKEQTHTLSHARNETIESQLSSITVVGREKPRASSASGARETETETKTQKTRIENGVRYVQGINKRARSQDHSF